MNKKSNIPYELTISLWQVNRGFINDSFKIYLPDNQTSPVKQIVIFRDVYREDIANGIYLVSRIYKFESIVQEGLKFAIYDYYYHFSLSLIIYDIISNPQIVRQKSYKYK